MSVLIAALLITRLKLRVSDVAENISYHVASRIMRLLSKTNEKMIDFIFFTTITLCFITSNEII